MKKRDWLMSGLLLILPVVLAVALDPASRLSVPKFLSCVLGTIFFIDLPIAMCLLHEYRPQWFRSRKTGFYSIVPWVIFALVCWGFIALDMTVAILLGKGPENGFTVFCTYCFAWAYIWITMIPIGLLYLLFCLFRRRMNRRQTA